WPRELGSHDRRLDAAEDEEDERRVDVSPAERLVIDGGDPPEPGRWSFPEATQVMAKRGIASADEFSGFRHTSLMLEASADTHAYRSVRSLKARLWRAGAMPDFSRSCAARLSGRRCVLLVGHNPPPQARCPPDSRAQTFELYDLTVVHEQIHLRAVVFHV